MPPPGDGLRSHPKAPHLRLVVNRVQPRVHCEMDDAMKDLIRALDIVAAPAMKLVR